MVTDRLTNSLLALLAVVPHFQRAVNLKYDLGSAEHVAAYVPTRPGAAALADVLRSTEPGGGQRARVLVGAYGTGKSLLAVVLAGILSGDPGFRAATDLILRRLREARETEAAAALESYRAAGRRLLPVVLSGDEGDLESAFGRGLLRALERAGLSEIRPPTVYHAALDTIARWERDFPDVHTRFRRLIAEHGGTDFGAFLSALADLRPEAYSHFRQFYPMVAAGAEFYPFAGQSIVSAFEATARALRSRGYDGLAIFYDEFGRVLETRAGEPFGRDAMVLQELAELANHSGEAQLHLVLVTHKSLRQYALGLSDQAQREWMRIEGRFRILEIDTDPLVSYRLIAAALDHASQAAWPSFRRHYATHFDTLYERTERSPLFAELGRNDLLELVVEGAYPLHPVATYCLPRLSERVAQNERTLFTFLASDDPHGLRDCVAREAIHGEQLPLVTVDRLWDYFADAVKNDTGPGGVHRVWLSVESALRKVGHDPSAARLVKALGVIHACGVTEELRPDDELLAFSLDCHTPADVEALQRTLQGLRDRKAIIKRRLTGYWEFIDGSDVDFEREVRVLLEQRPASLTRLRPYLERLVPPNHVLARRYNDDHAMVRFFPAVYRTVNEAEQVHDWVSVLRERDYADGLLVHLLVTNSEELARAKALAQRVRTKRVVFVVPRVALSIVDPLSEVYALEELRADPSFNERDPRVEQEVVCLLEEATDRLVRAMEPLTEPGRRAEWYHAGQPVDPPVTTRAHASQVVSKICEEEFPDTPIIANEALNRREPSRVQERAAEKVIEALLEPHLTADLGLSGRGPDWAIFVAAIRRTGLLQQCRDGSWCIDRPSDQHNAAMARIWDVVHAFAESATGAERPLAELMDRLQMPPFGLRRGVLPVLLAAALRPFLQRATFRRAGEPVGEMTGPIFTEMCRRPDLYTLRVEPWDSKRQAIIEAIDDVVGDRILPGERKRQPLRAYILALLRWLQSLPKYARDTNCLSEDALAFRQSIRLGMTEPASALFGDLLHLLAPDDRDARASARARLTALMEEISTSYLDLIRRVEHHVAEGLGQPNRSVAEALAAWVRGLEAHTHTELAAELFSDPAANGLIDEALRPHRDGVLDRVAVRLTGLPLRDWSDATEEQFVARLAVVRDLVEEAVLGRSSGAEPFIEVSVREPDGKSRVYRFRQVAISPEAQRLIEYLESTIDTSGRVLPPDERRVLGLRILEYLLRREG